jgi:hypothetical protein
MPANRQQLGDCGYDDKIGEANDGQKHSQPKMDRLSEQLGL